MISQDFEIDTYHILMKNIKAIIYLIIFALNDEPFNSGSKKWIPIIDMSKKPTTSINLV